MTKSVFILFLLFVSLAVPAQKDSSFNFYTRGLNAFNAKDYKLADSLYTIAAEIKQHPDTYYNRALTRMMLNNREGYCEDLCFAAVMGDKECDTLFRKECGTADTTFTDLKDKPANRLNYSYYSVVYQSGYRNANMVVKYDRKKKFVSSRDVKKDSTAAPIPDAERMPEFPGGNASLEAFIAKNLKYPPEQLKNKPTGQLIIRFAVNRLGYLENIKVTKPVENCPQCSREAVRLLMSMPRWRPASYKGQTVKVFSNLPLLFKP